MVVRAGHRRRQAHRHHAGRLFGRSGHQEGQAPDLLHHQRHPHHRQGGSQPADLSPAAERPGRRGDVHLFTGDALHDAGVGRGRPDHQRDEQTEPVRFRHLPRRHLQQHAVQRAAVVHRRPGRKGDHPELGGPRRRRHHRLPEALQGRRARQDHPLVPGAGQPRSLLDRVHPRGRRPPEVLRQRHDLRLGRRPRRPEKHRQARLLHGHPRRFDALRRHRRRRARWASSRALPRSWPTPTAAPC